MDIAELDYRVFEYSPSFQVVWVLTEWQITPKQRMRLRNHTLPGPVPKERTERMTAWATTVLEWHPPLDHAANELWDKYMDAAEMVLEK
jgi:hypothetical protein